MDCGLWTVDCEFKAKQTQRSLFGLLCCVMLVLVVCYCCCWREEVVGCE